MLVVQSGRLLHLLSVCTAEETGKEGGQGHCGPVATGGFHLGSVPGVIFFKSTAADST